MADDPKSGVQQTPSLLLSVLRRILRPLVRLLVQQQVTYPQLATLLKAVYVEVAQSEFRLEGRRDTLSRLTLLTGIHRREIKRIQQREVPDAPLPRAIALGAQILARWVNSPEWCDADGQARALPREPAARGGGSFDDLVRSVSVDIHPRSVLDEWLRLGIAEIDAEARVRLVSSAFVPTRGFEEKAHFVGRNLRDHIAAASENLLCEPSPFLERSVYYHSLPADAVGRLQALAQELGQQTLRRVDDEARRARDHGELEGPRRRMTFGVYFYETASDADASPAASVEDESDA